MIVKGVFLPTRAVTISPTTFATTFGSTPASLFFRNSAATGLVISVGRPCAAGRTLQAFLPA
jgi:hypothetical protein